jgi:hypothetical protein
MTGVGRTYSFTKKWLCNSVLAVNGRYVAHTGSSSVPRIPLNTGEGDVIGWGQTFSVLTDRELSAVQLRISRFGPNTPTGLIEVSVSEFNTITSTLGATIASTSVPASNFDAPLGSDVPISTIDLSASGGQLDSAKTYLLSLVSMGGFDGTAVAPYAATDIYAGGNSYYAYVPLPPAIYLFGTGLLGLIGISRRKKAA